MLYNRTKHFLQHIFNTIDTKIKDTNLYVPHLGIEVFFSAIYDDPISFDVIVILEYIDLIILTV